MNNRRPVIGMAARLQPRKGRSLAGALPRSWSATAALVLFAGQYENVLGEAAITSG
jgi:hypothetical protein